MLLDILTQRIAGMASCQDVLGIPVGMLLSSCLQSRPMGSTSDYRGTCTYESTFE